MTGVSPKRFCQTLRGEAVEQSLDGGDPVLAATYVAGLSSPSRTQALMVSLRGMTPGEFGNGGAALTLHYGVHETPFGPCLIVLTHRGICKIRFLNAGDDVAAELRRTWPRAKIIHAREETEQVAQSVLGAAAKPGPLSLHVKGTNFQLRVHKALLAIAPGTTSTYREVARSIRASDSARAVGNAVSKNPVAVLIPCHRVLRANGALGGYRWGTGRKRGLLAMEQACLDPPS